MLTLQQHQEMFRADSKSFGQQSERPHRKAVERISYGMPYYEYEGRLVYFSFMKNHIGLYIPSPIVKEHESELKAYETTEATIRLPLDKELPVALIKKLVKSRIERNEAKNIK
jgi:uncharacterized protein YdhG (YjbR/CyaY superfamily)